MPEGLEVEYYRRLAEGALGRRIAAVEVPDPHCLSAGTTVVGLDAALTGTVLDAAGRRGKLLVLSGTGPPLGIRFGMTGGLLLDNRAAIEQLLYSPSADDDRWIRFGLRFDDGGALQLHDPRRLARVRLDPDLSVLGPDALEVTLAQLRSALAGRTPGGGPPLKARLLDQSRLAGVGNLLGDEILWRAGLSPLRPSGSLDAVELRRLHRHLRSTLGQLLERGGSHTGDLMAERRPGGHCPKDGSPLVRATVGGRTTFWCPAHQL
jgi:formamidopyrimidine-DNA glycosylase